MPELMAWADLTISAGGSTSWELAFMGLPAILIILAENQLLLSEKLAQRQIVLNLGWHTQVTSTILTTAMESLRQNFSQRHAMTRLGQELVDGWGSTRVVNCLITGIEGE
jgi:spore coat polysaccharide biosynthesis predicted glycosyltransferase SpsG